MYLEIEDLASNALIELMKAKNERFVSYKDRVLGVVCLGITIEKLRKAGFSLETFEDGKFWVYEKSLKRERSEGTVGCFSGRESPRRI